MPQKREWHLLEGGLSEAVLVRDVVDSIDNVERVHAGSVRIHAGSVHVRRRRRRSGERRRAEEEAEEKRLSQLSETIQNAVSNITYPGEGKLEVDHLEVDDGSDDDEDGEFDINGMQFGQLGGKLGHMRSSRLTAH